MPRQFGAGEHVVFTGDIVPKTLTLFLKWSPKCCAPQIPRQFGAGEQVVFTGDIVPKTLTLFLKRN